MFCAKFIILVLSTCLKIIGKNNVIPTMHGQTNGQANRQADRQADRY